MNTAIFWRLVWKEYRQQRALWTAIALTGLIFQAAVLIYCVLNGVSDLPDRLFTVALSVPVLYALGCGAALFAGEHEAETFPFQQSLPVSAGRVFFAKFAFAGLSALLLFPVLWSLAFAMASWTLPDALWHLQLWTGGVVTTIEVLIWAVFGSLILRRVLPAAIVGGVTAALLGCGALSLMLAFGGHFVEQQANEYFSTIPLRACFAMFALAISVKLGRQWFNESPISWTSPATRLVRLNAAIQHRAAPATGLTVLTRLMWHEWRQGRATMLWCLLGYVVLGTWLAIGQFGSEVYLSLLPAIATIFGASAFAADQRQGQFQYFTEHGVRPRLVWLSRQLVWGSALIAITVIAASLQTFARLPQFDVIYAKTVAAIGFALLTYTTGQLCSILIRSGIVAVFTAVMCSVLLGLWVGLNLNFGVPSFISAWPLPFILFWASWLYAPKWIQQRQTWRARVVTVASIVVPLLGVVIATGAYRVYEIPAITLSFDPAIAADYDTPAARETAAMYHRAEMLLRPKPEITSEATPISARDDERKEGIQLFLVASARDRCRFNRWVDEPGIVLDREDVITAAVLAEAKARLDAGDLKGAEELYRGLLRFAGHFYQQHREATYLQRGTMVEQRLFPQIVEWANHDAQSSANVLRFLKELEAWFDGHHPDWEKPVIAIHEEGEQLLALDRKVMEHRFDLDSTNVAGITALGWLLPWETYRTRRLLDIHTESELQGLRAMRERTPRIAPFKQYELPWDVQLTLSRDETKLIRSVEIMHWNFTTPLINSLSPSQIRQFATWERQYRAGRKALEVQLALIAWKVDRGAYPATLSELEVFAFDRLPLDPYTDLPFVYFPEGLEFEVWDDANGGMAGAMGMMGGIGADPVSPSKPRIARIEPTLWSPGELLQFTPVSRSNQSLTAPTLDRFSGPSGSDAASAFGIFQVGVRYPLPLPKQQPSNSSDNADALPNDE